MSALAGDAEPDGIETRPRISASAPVSPVMAFGNTPSSNVVPGDGSVDVDVNGSDEVLSREAQDALASLGGDFGWDGGLWDPEHPWWKKAAEEEEEEARQRGVGRMSKASAQGQ